MKWLRWFSLPFVFVALIVLLLLMGAVWGVNVLIRFIQYRAYRLVLMGLESEQQDALLHLLQYKYLWGYQVAARELVAGEMWRCQIEASTRRTPLIARCRSLNIPEWRIRVAS